MQIACRQTKINSIAKQIGKIKFLSPDMPYIKDDQDYIRAPLIIRLHVRLVLLDNLHPTKLVDTLLTNIFSNYTHLYDILGNSVCILYC